MEFIKWTGRGGMGIWWFSFKVGGVSNLKVEFIPLGFNSGVGRDNHQDEKSSQMDDSVNLADEEAGEEARQRNRQRRTSSVSLLGSCLFALDENILSFSQEEVPRQNAEFGSGLGISSTPTPTTAIAASPFGCPPPEIPQSTTQSTPTSLKFIHVPSSLPIPNYSQTSPKFTRNPSLPSQATQTQRRKKRSATTTSSESITPSDPLLSRNPSGTSTGSSGKRKDERGIGAGRADEGTNGKESGLGNRGRK